MRTSEVGMVLAMLDMSCSSGSATFPNESETTLRWPHATDEATQMGTAHKRIHTLLLLRGCRWLGYAARDTMYEKWKTGKDLKGNGRGPTEVLSRDLPGENEKKSRNPSIMTPVYRPRFKPRISRVWVQSVNALPPCSNPEVPFQIRCQ
jgi:hypothetical protein